MPKWYKSKYDETGNYGNKKEKNASLMFDVSFWRNLWIITKKNQFLFVHGSRENESQLKRKCVLSRRIFLRNSLLTEFLVAVEHVTEPDVQLSDFRI